MVRMANKMISDRHPGFLDRAQPDCAANRRSSTSAGVSLIEILLIISVLALSILPITILIQGMSGNSKNSYINSSRNMLINKLVEEIDPENPNFYSAYNDGSIQTFTESGYDLGYMRKVDTANSNAMRRRILFYIYKTPSDAQTDYLYKYSRDFYLNELRIDCGGAANTPYADSSGQMWLPDAYAYDGTNKVPGYSGSRSVYSDNTAGIDNTVEDPLYQTASEVTSTTVGDSFSYSFNVDNGNYLVQLYFAELSGSAVNRYTDVTIESSTPSALGLDEYNPATSAGTFRRAEIKSANITVSDGVLNITVANGNTANPATNKARLHAIVLRRKA